MRENLIEKLFEELPEEEFNEVRRKFINLHGGFSETVDWLNNKIDYVEKKLDYHRKRKFPDQRKISFNEERLEKYKELSRRLFPENVED